MFKNAKKLKVIALLSVSSFLLTGCFGSMALTKKVHNWNQGASGNKFVQSLLFWGMIIVPVYPITLFVDAVFLNTVEFWSGSNPIAMADGDREVQVVTNENNETFEITATKNRFDIKQIEGQHAGVIKTYVFNTEEKAWYSKEGDVLTKISQIDDNMVTYFAPDGNTVTKELH